MGPVIVEGWGSVEDDDAGSREPRATAIATMTTRSPATRFRRIRIRRVGRAGRR
jgi:hypothetical protein